MGRTVWLSVLLCSLGGCLQAIRSNAYDPKAPDTIKAPANITGRVVLEGPGAPADIVITATQVRSGDDAGRLVQTQAQDDGQFYLEAKPETYNVVVSAPGHQIYTVSSVVLLPGDAYDLGTVVLSVAKGRISGNVFTQAGIARGGDSPADAANIFLSRADGIGGVYTARSNSKGYFETEGLPAGDYIVRATLTDFAPAYAQDPVKVIGGERAVAPDLRLYPASAVVHFSEAGLLSGAYTATPNVTVELFAFVAFLTDMRISEDPTFSDASLGDTDYRTYATAVPWVLKDQEGAHTVFAQFRDKSGLQTDVFSARITLDRAPPELQSVAIVNTNGFVTSALGELTISGKDSTSGLAAYQIALDPDFTGAPRLAASGNNLVIPDTVSLGSDGPKTIYARLIDKAGNISASKAVTVFKDAHAPSTTAPAVVIGDGLGTARDLAVSITFQVAGDRTAEPLFVAVGNAPGLSGASPRVAIDSPTFSHTLAPGLDGLRTVCAVFSDAAGNATSEVCQNVTLDRSGALHGSVTFEGIAAGDNANAGVSVTLANAYLSTSVPAATTNSSGAFSFSSVPAGGGYILGIARNGYETVLDQDITIVAGVDQDRGTYSIRIARGIVSGRVTLADKTGNQHGGIVISDVLDPSIATVTGPDGSFSLSAPVGVRTFAASQDNYITANFPPVTITSNGTHALGSLAIARQSGDFRVCKRVSQDPTCATTVQYTKDLTVGLGLSYPNAVAYYASESATPPAPSGVVTPFGTGNVDFTLAPGADGPRTIYTWIKDNLGALSPQFSSPIVLDTTPPTPGAFAIDDAAIYSTDAAGNVVLSVQATDAYSGLKSVRVSNEDNDFVDALDRTVPYATAITHTLQNTEGLRTVYVSYCDLLDNCTAGSSSDTITLDRTPPSSGSGVSFVINLNSAYATSPFVTLNIGAGDAVGVRYGAIASLDTLAFSALLPGSNDIPYTLSGSDGSKTVYAQFVDAAGNVTTAGAFSDVISLDRAAPTAAVVSIDQGAYTRLRPLTLTLGATAASQMLLHVGISEDFSASVWNTYATADASLTLPTGEGTYTVYARFRDDAGNETSTVTDSIVYDKTAPTLASVSYAVTAAPDGNKYSKPGSVSVDLFALNADRMTVAEDGVVDTELASAYATRQTVTLPSVQGARPIAVSFSDLAGNSIATPVTDTIYVDTTAPTGSITITQGAYTSSTAVLLSLTYGDTMSGTDAVAIVNGTSCSGAVFESIGTSRNWTLPSTQGSKTVAACFRDRVGNVSTPYTATTIVDTLAPSSVTISLSSGASTIASGTAVPVQITATDTNPLEYQISEDPNFSNVTAWTTLSVSPLTTTTNLSSGDGNKTLYVRVRDAAGNTTTASDSVILDTSDPYGATLELSPTTYTSTRVGITATFSAVGATQRCLYGDFVGAPVDNCASGSSAWTTLSSASAVLTLTTGNGTKIVYAVFRDDALRTSAVASDSVVYDDIAPVVTAASVTLTGLAKDGASTARTRTPSISATLSGFAAADALSGVTEMQVSEDNTFNGVAWQSLASALPWVLSAGDATKSLHVRVRDAAGNVSAFKSGSILLDTSPPSVSVLINGEGAGGAVTTTTSRRRDVTLALSVSDGTGSGVTGSDMQLARDAAFSSASFQSFAAAPSFDLVDPSIATCQQRIHINEIATNASIPIEIHNTFATAVNFSQWKLECGDNATSVTATLPNIVLRPNGFTRLHNGAGTNSETDIFLSVSCPFTSGGAGYALLKDAGGIAVDYVRFNGSTHTAPTGHWSTGSVTCAPTCGRTQLAFDRNLAGDWCAQSASMGSQNGSACALTSANCSAIDGVVAAFVKVRDLAGNEAVAAASTVLDTTPAVGTVTINDGAAFATSQSATLQLFAFDGMTGVDKMALALGATGVTNFQTYTSSSTFTLASAQADQTVFAVFRDLAGNDSPAILASDAITYDTISPTLTSVTLTGLDKSGSSTTLTRTAGVVVAISGATGNPVDMLVSEDVGFDGASWQPYVASFPWILSPGDGAKTLHIELRDLAGNVSASYSGTITLDETAPSAGVVLVNGNATYTNTLAANVTFKIAGSAVDYSFDGTSWTACPSCSATVFSTAVTSLTTDQGTQKVQMYFRDAAGNVSTSFGDDIFYDSLRPPTPPIITAVSPKTTSVFLDFSDVSDDTSVADGSSGIAYYQVTVTSQQGATVASAVFTSSEGTITGLPALEIYGFTVRAFDNAGNNSTPSSQFTSQVGLSTSVIDSFGNLGAMGDKVAHYRGVAIFPRILSSSQSTGPAYVLCDMRRNRCQDSGIAAGVDRNTLAPSLFGSFEFAPAPVGDSVWGAFVLTDFSSSTIKITRMTGSADLLVGGGSWTTPTIIVAEPAGWFHTSGSLQLASNGKLLFLSYWLQNGSGSYRLVGRSCSLSMDCSNGTNWSSGDILTVSTTSPRFPILAQRITGSNNLPAVSLEAGENYLWMAYPSIDRSNGATSCKDPRSPGQNDTCGFTVMGCNAATLDCTLAGNWSSTRLRATETAEPGSLGYPHAVTLLETRGKLNVLGLESPAPAVPPAAADVKRGLYLWQCNVSSGCSATGQFGTPGLVQKLFQPVTVGTDTESPPRLSFDTWGGFLHLAAVDYSTGVVFHSRCFEQGNGDCLAQSSWTRANVLSSGDIRGQANMVVSHGNPVLLVGRDPARAFLIEPNTPAPIQRSIVPSFTNAGVIASWSPRAATSADGFRVDTATTEWGDTATSFALAPDGSYSEVTVSQASADSRYGTVVAYRGNDRSLAEPLFGAKQGGRVNWYADVGIDEVSPVVSAPDHQPDDRHCHIYAFRPTGASSTRNGNLQVLTCPKAADCSNAINWRNGFYDLPRGATGQYLGEYVIDAVSNATTGGNAFIAYTAVDSYAPSSTSHGDLRFAKISLAANCAPGGSLTATGSIEQDVPSGGSSARRNPGYLSATIASGRFFVAYRQTANSSEGLGRMSLASCVVGASCDVPSFNKSSWAQDYFGGPITGVTLGGVPKLAWLAQTEPGPSNKAPVFLACRPGVLEDDCCKGGTAGCNGASHWSTSPTGAQLGPLSPSTAFSYADMRPSISGNKLLLATDRFIAWCDTSLGGACESASHWARSAFSPEVLAAAQLSRGALSYDSGRFMYTGFGADGAAIATCSDRCWLQDNWHGGFTNKNPEMGASLNGRGFYFGSNAFIDANLSVTSAFSYRVPTNPFFVGMAFVRNASFAACNRFPDSSCGLLP